MTEFNIYEEKILQVLHRARIPISTREVARRADISWNTAKKYLEILFEDGYIESYDAGNAIEWEIIEE